MDIRSIVNHQNEIIDKFYGKLADTLRISDQFLASFCVHQCFNNREKDFLSNSEWSRVEKVNKLLDIVKRKHLFREFYDALLKTRQLQLAEYLKSEDSSLPDPVLSRKNVTSIIINSPSQEACEANRRFYEAEIQSFTDVPETCGIIENLSVDMVDLPPGTKLFFDSDKMYRNFTNPKGLALVINNRNFVANGGLPDRLGTDVDRTNISNLLIKLGYDVKVKDNLRSHEIASIMFKFANKDHSAYDSSIVVVLSHGKNGKIYGVDCQEIEVEKIVSSLDNAHCPSLSGKPKIFIFQACRGEKYDLGLDLADYGEHKSYDANNSNVTRKMLRQFANMDFADASTIKKIPTGADILMAFATTPGYVSWRNSLHGSWFIQSICEVFSRSAKTEEIQHMFTEVNNLVARRLSSSSHVQVPEPCSRLLKRFYFFPGISFDFDSSSLV